MLTSQHAAVAAVLAAHMATTYGPLVGPLVGRRFAAGVTLATLATILLVRRLPSTSHEEFSSGRRTSKRHRHLRGRKQHGRVCDGVAERREHRARTLS